MITNQIEPMSRLEEVFDPIEPQQKKVDLITRFSELEKKGMELSTKELDDDEKKFNEAESVNSLQEYWKKTLGLDSSETISML